jgi:uncharacterized protein YuzE
MRVDYDAGADTAYIYFRDLDLAEWKHTYAAVADTISFDFDDRTRLVRLEVREASRRLPHEFLASAPNGFATLGVS